MAFNNNSPGSPEQGASSPNAAGAANASAQDGGFNDIPFWAQFARGGGGGRGRGWGGRGGGAFWQDFMRPETVSLEGGEPSARGHHHHGPPPFGHHHPVWPGGPFPHPPPPAGPHPDPPLAPVPPPPGFEGTSPPPGFDPAGLMGLFGHHARNFAGDLATHFGATPTDGSTREGPGFGHHHHGRGGGFGGWRGRGGLGRGGMRGGWRGAWPGHHHGRDFVFPRMDIYKKDNTFTVTVNLPGLQKQNVDISVADGLLTISGEFPSDKPSSGGGGEDPFAEYDIMDDEGEEVLMESAGNLDDDDGHYIRHERPSGKFKRSVRLPGWVDLDSIKATMAEGVLTLVIEKPAPEGSSSSTRKLKIG